MDRSGSAARSWTARQIGVVVPARNEEDRLSRCMSALSAAARAVPVPVRAVVVLDACTDHSSDALRTADLSGFRQVRMVRCDVRSVGSARAIGMTHVLAQPDEACDQWLATTDADSEVRSDWFEKQLQHAESGAEVVVGTVEVSNWAEHAPQVRHRFSTVYRPGPGHRHAHGANLSMRAETYLRAGGFQALRTGEDVALVARLVELGSAIAWASDLPVVTSARLRGRAPSGFAGYLRHLGKESLDAAP